MQKTHTLNLNLNRSLLNREHRSTEKRWRWSWQEQWTQIRQWNAHCHPPHPKPFFELSPVIIFHLAAFGRLYYLLLFVDGPSFNESYYSQCSQQHDQKINTFYLPYFIGDRNNLLLGSNHLRVFLSSVSAPIFTYTQNDFG